MLALGQLPGKALDAAGGDAQTIHAAVDLEMEGSAFAAALRCGAIQLCQLLAAVNDCCQSMFDQALLFALHKAGQDEYWVANAGFTQGNAFVRASHAEPIGSGLLESFGDLRAAMTVAIAFDDRENLARRLALFARRIHVFADGVEVVDQGR